MTSLGAVALPLPAMSPTTSGEMLYERFRAEPDTLVIAVVDEAGRPVGLVERTVFTLKMAAEYGRALWARRPLSLLMDTQPLVVEASVRIVDFLQTALSDRPSDLLRGFIVTANGAYFGVGTPLVLLKAASDANAAAAAEMTELARNLTIANTNAERQRQFTETVIDNMPAMVTVRDSRGVIRVLNRAGEDLMGRPRNHVLGRHLRDFYPEEETRRFLAEDLEVLSSGQMKRVEREEVVLPTGERRTLRSRKLALPGSEGAPRYLLVVSEDVTGEVEAEARIAGSPTTTP